MIKNKQTITNRARNLAKLYVTDLAKKDNSPAEKYYTDDEQIFFDKKFEHFVGYYEESYLRPENIYQTLEILVQETCKVHITWDLQRKRYMKSLDKMCKNFIEKFSDLNDVLPEPDVIKNNILKNIEIFLKNECVQENSDVHLNPSQAHTIAEPPAKKRRLEIPLFEDLLLQTPFPSCIPQFKLVSQGTTPALNPPSVTTHRNDFTR